MLSTSYRLRGKRAHDRVQRARPVVRGSHLTLRVVDRGDREPPRVAVAVGRHVSVRAVDRNTVTRRIRAALRHELPHVRRGVDLRFSASARAAAYSWEQVVSDVRDALTRAGLLRSSM